MASWRVYLVNLPARGVAATLFLAICFAIPAAFGPGRIVLLISTLEAFDGDYPKFRTRPMDRTYGQPR